MKKTLIALLALGSVAMATPTSDPTAELSTPWYENHVGAVKFSNASDLIKSGNMTFFFDRDSISNYALTFSITTTAERDTLEATINAERSGYGQVPNDLSVMARGATITLGRAWLKVSGGQSEMVVLDNIQGGNSLEVDGAHTYMLAFANYNSQTGIVGGEGIDSHTAYLFDLTSKQYIYAENVTGFATQLLSGTSKVWSNQANQYVRLGQLYDLTGMQQADVVKRAFSAPEPATGTLSLLALAGLCIRRRK